MSERPLYGGAVGAVIPDGWVDASDVRQIPDTHEVFSDPNSDASIIIELLDLTPNVPADQLAMFHFQELAKANAAEAEVTRSADLDDALMPHLPPSPEAVKQVVVGRQMIAKFKESAANLVHVYLAAVRLPAPYDTEILLTLNAPAAFHPQSSSASLTPIGDNTALCESIFGQLIGSFKIHDYGLFDV